MLKKPLRHRVTYQLWNVGSQRLTLWGDPQYAADFARSCRLGGGEGFEVFAPLTNKGYGDAPGAWPVIQDPQYRVGRWEQDRYWMFYLAFGRLGYDPETKPEAWRREFRHRFGEEAAPHVEEAYAAASGVLPWITTALLPGASEWSWWPEMDTGGDLETYSHIQPSDTGRFAPARSWKKTAGWRWEDWDVLSAEPKGRHDTLFLVDRLKQSAQAVDSAWRKAGAVPHKVDAEWRITEVDLRLLAGLAEYHALKLHAAHALALREKTEDSSYEAIIGYELNQALEAWKKIVAATDGIYHDNLVFGISADSPRSKNGHHHTGHWRDRLKELEADPLRRTTVASDSRFFHRDVGGDSDTVRHKPPRTISPEMKLEIEIADHFAPVASPAGNPFGNASRPAANPSGATAPKPAVSPGPVKDWPPGPYQITVHARPLNQTRPWRTTTKTINHFERHGRWSLEVPAEAIDPNYDLQYFFTVGLKDKPDQQWPKPGENGGQPYFVVPLATPAADAKK
jgi:hypothetical protein